MATLYHAEHVHIAETQTRIPISVKDRISESESVPLSEPSNVFKA